MGLTHRDFFRAVERLADGDTFELSNSSVRIARSFGPVLIELGQQSERRIGPIVAIPVTPVRFVFSSGTESDWKSFMTQFDRRFQRAGG